MPKPTLDELIKILNRCRGVSGDSLSFHGAPAPAIKAASAEAGLVFPADFQAWLARVDGVEVTGADFYGVQQVSRTLNASPEYRSVSFLPVAGDSCGNDYVMALTKDSGDPPIVFVEGILGRTSACFIAASSLYAFIKFALERSMSPDDSQWPGDPEYVLREDPKIASFGYPLPWEA